MTESHAESTERLFRYACSEQGFFVTVNVDKKSKGQARVSADVGAYAGGKENVANESFWKPRVQIT